MDNRALLSRIEQRLKDLGISAMAASIAATGSPDLVRNLRRAVKEGRTTALNATSLSQLAVVLDTSVEWLVNGRHVEAPKASGIPVVGVVGAGSSVMPIGETSAVDLGDEIGPFTADDTMALIVRGDSQYPRFLDGEKVLVSRHATLPDDLVGEYAAVDTDDGRRLIKIIRRGSRPDLFHLESHNAPLEEDVKVIAAFRYLGAVAAPPHAFARRRRS